jgi:hypothetical protein
MHKDLVQIIKRNTLYCYYNFHASVQMKKKRGLPIKSSRCYAIQVSLWVCLLFTFQG